MSGLFAGTPLERPVTCEVCSLALAQCKCPRDASGRVLQPLDQIAMIRCEKRRGGRGVTTVSGLDANASDMPELLRMLKSRCASGGTVEAGVIEVQGDHREAVRAALSEAGYRTRVIS